jgi:hypothetical protein
MRPNWIATGSFGAALAVIAGAFGTDTLASCPDAHSLTLWDTGARCLMYEAGHRGRSPLWKEGVSYRRPAGPPRGPGALRRRAGLRGTPGRAW